MINADARRVPAQVTHEHVRTKGSVREFPRHAMGLAGHLADLDPAVAPAVDPTRPLPAALAHADACPESLRQGRPWTVTHEKRVGWPRTLPRFVSVRVASGVRRPQPHPQNMPRG
jgi:hypothetical protein